MPSKIQSLLSMVVLLAFQNLSESARKARWVSCSELTAASMSDAVRGLRGNTIFLYTGSNYTQFDPSKGVVLRQGLVNELSVLYPDYPLTFVEAVYTLPRTRKRQVDISYLISNDASVYRFQWNNTGDVVRRKKSAENDYDDTSYIGEIQAAASRVFVYDFFFFAGCDMVWFKGTVRYKRSLKSLNLPCKIDAALPSVNRDFLIVIKNMDVWRLYPDTMKTSPTHCLLDEFWIPPGICACFST